MKHVEKLIRIGFLLVLPIVHAALSSGTPFVSAGEDRSVYSGDPGVYLNGEVSDNGNVLDSLLWTQVRGPINIDFIRTSAYRRIQFPDTSGIFQFELRAFYGNASYADTVKFTVTKSRPFKIISPPEGSSVAIGKTYVVKWQMDPLFAVNFLYSTDEGLTWILSGNSIQPPTDSLVWTVPGNLPAGATCLLELRKYADQKFSTQSSVVLQGTSIRSHSSAFNVTKPSVIYRDGVLIVAGLLSNSKYGIEIFDLQGKMMYLGLANNGKISLPQLVGEKGMLLFRIKGEEGIVADGSVVVTLGK